MKRFQNIINKFLPILGIFIISIIWYFISYFELVPSFMLPSPIKVIEAFFNDFQLLMHHTKFTLLEALYGLSIGIILAFIISLLMEYFNFIYKLIYPLLIITQTIPTIAIAPLIVLWFGYDMTPKIILIVIVVFFPITIGLLDGYKSADKDMINMMKSMGANKKQIIWNIKLPFSLPYFFSSLKVSASYAIVGAVIAEWLGGNDGLGVYMTRVRKSFAFDKMFAVILLISILSILLMKFVDIVQLMSMPWKRIKEENRR